MAEAGTKKRTFGDKVRGKVDGVKRKAADYKSAIQDAYTIGYRQGVKDSEILPKRRGAATAAQTGYGNGIRDQRKYDKYNKRVKR